MDLTKEQLSELICKHTEKENGLQDLLEIMLESLMVSERRTHFLKHYLRKRNSRREKPTMSAVMRNGRHITPRPYGWRNSGTGT